MQKKTYEELEQENKRLINELAKRNLMERDIYMIEKLALLGRWEWNYKENKLTWSDEIYEIFGVDKNTYQLSAENFEHSIHPDDIENFLQKRENALGNNDEMDIVHRIIRPSGEVRTVRERASIIQENGKPARILGTVQDISEQIELEKKQKAQTEVIRLNNERLESLLKISQYKTNSLQELLDYALNEAVNLTKSKIGYIYFYNEVTEKFTLNTWSKDVMKECAVMNPQTIYDLDKTGCWGEAVRQRKPIIINNYQITNPLVKGTPEGHVALYKFLTIPVFSDDKIVAVAGVANKEEDYDDSDIRQLNLLMDNVWRITEKLNLINNLKVAKEKAEESDKLKTAFLQNMSHEIRTPLNAICGFSGMLNKHGLSQEKQHNYIRIIQDSSNQLLSIVSDILTISSLETGLENKNLTTTNLNEIIDNVLEAHIHAAASQEIQICVTKQLNNTLSEIITDSNKITQILNKLVLNALKFTPKNGTIQFGYSIQGNEIEFYVKDTGIGIAKENHQKIFNSFTQIQNNNDKLVGGTGLGLSIAKGFVEVLGGKIWLDSDTGQGSTFYFTIPYIRKQNSEIKTTNEKAFETNSGIVLVAEDEEYNYMFIEEVLTEMNLTAIHTRNGKETCEIFKTNPQISLVLMDIKMPLMNGYEAAKIIKQINPHCPIIAQTAYALEHERARYEGIFDDYLPKPLDMDNLIDKISHHLHLNY